MLHKIQNFFLDLQQSDEETKKRWLVILASGSMAIVIALWAVYLNLTIENLGSQNSQKEEAGFLQTSQAGLQVISKEAGLKLSRAIASLKSVANQTNSITIQSANVGLILKDLEPIKPKKLP